MRGTIAKGVWVIPPKYATEKEKAYIEATGGVVAPKYEGIARRLEDKEVVPNDTIMVEQRGFAYGSPEISGSRFIITDTIYTCVTVVGYNSNKNLGFLAHIDSVIKNASEAMRKMVKVGATEMIIFGGDKETASSSQLISIIEGFLTIESHSISVVGKDTLRDVDQIYSTRRNKGHPIICEIGIDTSTGQIFRPKNIHAVTRMGHRLDTPELTYNGRNIAPVADFLKIAKRE